MGIFTIPPLVKLPRIPTEYHDAMMLCAELAEERDALKAERDEAYEERNGQAALVLKLKTECDMARKGRDAFALQATAAHRRCENLEKERDAARSSASASAAAMSAQRDFTEQKINEAREQANALKIERDNEIARRREVTERYSALVDAYADQANAIIALKKDTVPRVAYESVKRERDEARRQVRDLGMERFLGLATEKLRNLAGSPIDDPADTVPRAAHEILRADRDAAVREIDSLKAKLAKLAEIHEQRIAMREMRFESSREDRVLDKRMNEMFKELKSN
jgi:hypothetical protein